MDDWWFALPTATAILSLLYPDNFTVYDVIVCKEVEQEYRPNRSFSESLWLEYIDYREKVRAATPHDLSLRDKDRFLIGRAYRKGVEADCVA